MIRNENEIYFKWQKKKSEKKNRNEYDEIAKASPVLYSLSEKKMIDLLSCRVSPR